jgi:L-histidine Nalpha-methyltransferase
MIDTTISESDIAQTVKVGLTSPRKYLPSWLFYDEHGDKLFQEIMTLPEYYLTRCEREILLNKRVELGKRLESQCKEWDIIELGAGDGTKTKLLLESFLKKGLDINYYAIDISENVLKILDSNLKKSFPALPIKTISKEYFEGIDIIRKMDSRPKLVLFMGANIGNFEVPEAEKFLSSLSLKLTRNDILLIGIDLIKSPSVIAAAYNDSKGITKEFNLNVLKRLNKEFDGDFVPENFEHYPTYNPCSGAARSYLVSKIDQTAELKDLNLRITFKAWEPVYTEISQKYSPLMIKNLAKAADLSIEDQFVDNRKYFSVNLFRRNL